MTNEIRVAKVTGWSVTLCMCGILALFALLCAVPSRAFASMPEEIASLPTLDALNRTESTLSNGGKWSALAWDNSTSGHSTGQDTGTGWGPYDAFSTINGAYWNPAQFNDAKVGDAAAIKMQTAPGIEGRYVALWLDMGSPGTAKSGYQLRWTATAAANTYNVSLVKWVSGAETVLTSQSSMSIPTGTTLAIADAGGGLIAWQGSGGSLTPFLLVSDSSFSSGYAGIEASGSNSRLLNFQAGNLGSQTPPDTTISSGPSGATVPDVSFGFSANQGGASFECSLDGGAYSACASPKAYSGLSDSTHTFAVRATTTGGTDPTPAQRSFRAVEAAKAVIKTPLQDDFGRSEIPLANGKWTKSSWASEIGGSWLGLYHGYGSGGGLAGAYWNPSQFSDGEGSVLVSAKVGTGWTPAGQYMSLWLDAPSPGSARSGYEARFTGNGSESNYTVELSKWVGGTRTVLASAAGLSLPVNSTMALTETAGGRLAVWAGSSALSLVLSANDPTYASGYAGIDMNGGAGTAYNFRAGRIDVVPPDTTIQSGPSGTVLPETVSFTFTASEGGASFECSLDGGAYGACVSPKQYPSLASGPHTFRVRAVDAGGNADETPAERSFQIAKPPTVSTNAASGVKAHEATLKASVNPEGQATTYQFEYGTSISYGSKAPVSAKAAGSGSSAVEVGEAIAGLAVGTTYHFRIVATSGAGTSYGQDRTLTTPAAPVATTESAINVSAKKATLRATINPRGGATTYWFEYGTTTAYGLKVPLSAASAGSGSVPTEVNVAAEGLNEGSTYHYRVVAENEVGVAHGEDLNFKTPFLPEAETEPAKAVDANEAVLDGSVDPNGSETEYQFEYGTSTGYGSVITANEAGNGTAAVEASESVGYLKPETTYHYRLVAKSAAGTDFGADRTLKTSAAVMTPQEEEKLEAEEHAYTGAMDGHSLPGDFFGVHWTGSFEQMAEPVMMNAIKHSGSKFLRIVMAPGENATNEKIFRQASARGITVIPYIGSGEWPTSQAGQTTWTEYTQQAVEKYGPGGWFWNSVPGTDHPVHMWEIWNEPNLGSNSPSRNGSKNPYQEINAPGFGEFFDKMVKAAEAGAAKNKQTIEIMAPALFSSGASDCPEGGECHLSPADFLGQMGHQSDYDAVSLHPYVFKVGENPHPIEPEKFPQDLEKLKQKVYSYVSDVRHKLENMGVGGKDIWVTELGWPVQSDNPKSFPALPNEQVQKEAIETTFGMLKARHAELGIAHAIYFNIQDFRNPKNGAEWTAWDGHAGLRKGPGGDRPAWRGFAGLTPTGDPNWPPKKKGKNLHSSPHPHQLIATYSLETQGEQFLTRAEWGSGPLSSSYPNATEWQPVQPPEEGEAPGEILEVGASTTIPNLQPETTYHYRIATKNENGDVEQTEGLQFKTAPSTEVSASVKRTLNGEPGWVTVGGYAHEGGEGLGLTNLYVNVNFEKWENGQWVYKNTIEPHPVTNNGAYYEYQDWQVGKGLWRTRTVLPAQQGYEQSESGYHEFTIKTGYQLVAKHSGKCLDVTGANTANSATLEQWECADPATSQNQVFTMKPMGGGYYELIARHSGRCVDVYGASQSAGGVIDQYDCIGASNQLWLSAEVEPNGPENSYVNFVAKHSGQCLDVQNSSNVNGTPVLQYPCGNHQANQMWTFKSVESNDIATHTYVTLGERLNGHPGYQSVSGNVDTGAYPEAGRYVNVNFEKEVSPGNYQYIDTIEPHPTLDGAGHYSYENWGVGAGNWRVRTVFPGEGALAKSESEYHYFHIGDGYRFRFRHSGRCLSTSGGGTSNGTQIIQWDCGAGNPADGQVYSVVPVGGGYFQIRPDSNTNMCLDVTGANPANGAFLELYQCIPGAGNQLWYFTPISGQPPWFAAIAQHSGRCMNVEGSITANGARVLQWDCIWSGNEQWEWQSIG